MKVPSRVEPSWGTSIFEPKPSWNFFKNYNQISKFSTSIMIITNYNLIIYMNLCKTKCILGSWKLWFSYINEKLKEIKISAGFRPIFNFELKGKRSQAICLPMVCISMVCIPMVCIVYTYGVYTYGVYTYYLWYVFLWNILKYFYL